MTSTRSRRLLTGAVVLLVAAILALSGCSSSTTSSTSTSDTAGDSSTTDSSGSATSTTAQTVAVTTEAAEAFLATLSDEEQDAVLYSADDETKTTSWSNFPVTSVARAGLSLNEMTDEQREAALAVLESLLNDEAYETVLGIMQGDQEIVDAGACANSCGLYQYYIAFFGDPSTEDGWTVQYGGHHIGINATLDTDTITFAPTHLGVQPAIYTNDAGETVEPLAEMTTSAFAFYDSLTDDQKSVLYQGSEITDLVCAPGSTCSFPTGTGISGADLTDEQKQLLLDVIANWVGLADAETTATALAEIEATVDETYINWSGATEHDTSTGSGIYFQISGPNVYIEFANQQQAGDTGGLAEPMIGWNHIHTIYRDPSNDYAGTATQQEATQGGGR